MSDNGKRAATEGRPVLIEYECYSGVMAHIIPLNIPTLKAIQQKAKLVFPYPEKERYQQPEEHGFSEGQLTPAEDNPDYVAEVKRIDHERALWVDRKIFDHCVRFPAYPTREDMVRKFQAQLDTLREIAELPEDDFEAVLFHIVLSWNQPALNADNNLVSAESEYVRMIKLAIQTVALTPAEVTAGVRFFRPYVQQNTRREPDR